MCCKCRKLFDNIEKDRDGWVKRKEKKRKEKKRKDIEWLRCRQQAVPSVEVVSRNRNHECSFCFAWLTA